MGSSGVGGGSGRFGGGGVGRVIFSGETVIKVGPWDAPQHYCYYSGSYSLFVHSIYMKN